ncbi:DUF4998 domain-containing protein [Pararcticibacter amylolyticus]|uniref:DUF4998 domain-containing protein n=1 Tax=Pararcticibacter amylolyticus TaxID=2173175 RepID=A0A2U2P9Y5_9SPHI|nr:DUF4998 domain-containing protein [Pararcticibacter amylolyticus]PWG78180.1 hypothetical protein DDR33_23520 [Pararcticibacter amylolyticus]
MMKKTKITLFVQLAFALLLICQGCDKMEDSYKQYLEGGELIYPGKADSLKAFPGKNRVKLRWLIVSDPKVVGAKVYWNNKSDSVNVPIRKTSSTDTISVIIPGMEEGLYTFDVYTYDAAGHRSVGSQVIGEAYGASFQNTLANRLVKSVQWLNLAQTGTTPAFRGGEITWYSASVLAVFIDIGYTREDGSAASVREEPVRVPGRPVSFRETTRLPGWNKDLSFRYRTAFKPDSAAIDTFYTDYTVYNPH